MTILKGFVKNILQPKEGKGWVKETFVLKKFDDGKDVFCNVFLKGNQESVVDPSLLAKDVQFEAEYNAEYKNYAVKGEIVEVEHDLPEQLDETSSGVPTGSSHVATPVRRRGRKPGTAAAKVVAPTTTATKDIQAPLTSRGVKALGVLPQEDEAVSIIRQNLSDARALAVELGIEPTDDGLIALADNIGRCRVALRIEAGKDRRTTEWKGRK